MNFYVLLQQKPFVAFMGGAGAPLSAEESVCGLRQVIARLTQAAHGRFWTWEGREHPR